MTTPLTIHPAELVQLIFGNHEERQEYFDAALYHWCRRAGAPAMDLPSKIIAPSMAERIIAADPDELHTHVQVVVTPSLTYYVLWSRHHWLESAEKQRIKFFTSIADRASFDAKNAHHERMATIIARLIACGVPKDKANGCVHGHWKQSSTEDEFKFRIQSIEGLFGITGVLYEAPKQEAPVDQTVSSTVQA